MIFSKRRKPRRDWRMMFQKRGPPLHVEQIDGGAWRVSDNFGRELGVVGSIEAARRLIDRLAAKARDHADDR